MLVGRAGSGAAAARVGAPQEWQVVADSFGLRVLGGFALETSSGAVTSRLPRRRAEAALAVLAVCGDRGCTRERLISLLWPESDEAHSRQGLRDALSAIRQALGHDALLAGGDRVSLDPTVVGSDVTAFSQALASGRGRDAVQVYAGPLLEGFHVDDAPGFERWLDGERTRLAREYVETLEQLARAAERAGDWNAAVGWWGRAVEHDPLNSHLVLQQVQAMAAIGDRANAIKAADAHVLRLREELGLEPDRDVLARFEMVRRGEHAAPGAPERSSAPAADSTQGGEVHRNNREAGVIPSGGAPPSAVVPAIVRRIPRWVPWAAGSAALVVLAGVIGPGLRLRTRTAEPRFPRTAIAVLPFRNLSADAAHAYFAGGLHDQLMTDLGKIAALTVIERTSVSGYQQTSKSLRQIGEELGVGSVVEANVQVAGNRLRVFVKLLDPETGAQLWAEQYDSTLDDAFAVQSNVAQRIVAAVGATLTSAEASAIAAAPTHSPDAYLLYLQGLDYVRRAHGSRENMEIAQHLFERSLALDPAFAPAHAALSGVHGMMIAYFYDPSPARAALQRREAEVALALAPDLPQAHLAIGRLFLGRFDFGRALEEFRAALRGAPNDAEVWGALGTAHRRLGEWDSMDVAFEHASRLDPRNADLFYGRGMALEEIRRFPEAIAAHRRALTLAPDQVWAHIEIGWAYVKWKGEWDTLRAAIHGAPAEMVADQALTLLMHDRQPDSVLALLRAMPGPVGDPGPPYGSRTLFAASAHLLRGDSAAARAAFDSAVAILDAAERAHPDDWRLHGPRGTALAQLGRRTEALREARWLEQSDVYRKDRVFGPWARSDRAWLLVQLGESDAALTEFEWLLANPSPVSVYTLRDDPNLDPIRNDPRFQALLGKYRGQGPR